MFLEIVLNILSVLAIIVFGAFLVVVVADLILCMFDDHGGIIFKRKKHTEVVEETTKTEVKKDDIVVYSSQANPSGTYSSSNTVENKKEEMVDGHKVQKIDYDKAIEEQKALNAKKGFSAPAPQPKRVESAPKKNNDVFWDDENDDDFNDLLDEAVREAKKVKSVKKEEPKEDIEEIKEVKPAKSIIDEETRKELDELKALKEQQKQEIEEFKLLKEDFARQKEEELAEMKSNLDKAKAEELEKIRQEALKEQEKLEEMQRQLEEDQKRIEEQRLLDEQKLQEEHKRLEELRLAQEQKLLEEQEKLEAEQKKLLEEQEKVEAQRKLAEEQQKQKEQEKLEAKQEKLEAEQKELEEKQKEIEEKQKELEEMQKEETVELQAPIIKETIIRDEEEINKLKQKNLIRMNNRLSRIIKDTEKLQAQKLKELERLAEERKKLLEKEQEERRKEQERILEMQRANRERLLKQQENIRIKNEISKKLSEASSRAGKYKLDSKVVKITREQPQPEEKIVEETVTTVETIPHTDIEIKTVEKTPLAPVKASAKPLFDKEYYEAKLTELDEELKEAEKELRTNKSEYIPLTRIHKAYARDSEKLRKKEMQVAKQKVALYGVNSTKVDPNKKAKLDENLSALAELKDSVSHCEEVIRKNKDRYPVLEKNNRLITKQIDRINEDIKVCEKAIEYYNKHNK
ncbi:MAG: hypothetical protein E7345_01815 [Clostridiales bacterium]|nr:hypothetical protein [Clostridiales bacterium]